MLPVVAVEHITVQVAQAGAVLAVTEAEILRHRLLVQPIPEAAVVPVGIQAIEREQPVAAVLLLSVINFNLLPS